MGEHSHDTEFNPYCSCGFLAVGSEELTFTLTITLGNSTMRSGYDVGHALTEARKQIVRAYENTDVANDLAASGEVHDINGNTVGSWGVK